MSAEFSNSKLSTHNSELLRPLRDCRGELQKSVWRSTMPRYQPADSLASPRFTGVRTFARLPHVQTIEDVDVAVVGLPFDTGATFKVGARFGPESVRSASHML